MRLVGELYLCLRALAAFVQVVKCNQPTNEPTQVMIIQFHGPLLICVRAHAGSFVCLLAPCFDFAQTSEIAAISQNTRSFMATHTAVNEMRRNEHKGAKITQTLVGGANTNALTRCSSMHCTIKPQHRTARAREIVPQLLPQKALAKIDAAAATTTLPPTATTAAVKGHMIMMSASKQSAPPQQGGCR